jgi:hypothetical protein
MDKINILEELNRIKFLFDYRKGVVISEQEKTTTVTKEKTDSGIKTVETTKEGINIPYSQNVTFARGSNTLTPESYKSFTEAILNLINNNPETKKMLEEKNIQLTNISIVGAASNSWGGKKTGYDYENDRTTKVSQTPNDSGYVSNKNLAKQRAEIFSNGLIDFLKNQGIIVNENTPKEVSSVVINTGGFNDDNPNKPNNIKPGQYVSVNLQFNYVKITTKETFEPRFDPKYIIQGSYKCNGLSGNNTYVNINRVALKRCANEYWQIPVNGNENFNIKYTGEKIMGGNDFLAIYEIKFNKMFSDDIAKKKIQIDTKIPPFIRWNFLWDKGKIVKITIGNTPDGGENIINNNKLMNELKQYMNLPKYSPETKTYSNPKNSFENLIKKYL